MRPILESLRSADNIDINVHVFAIWNWLPIFLNYFSDSV